MYLLKSKLAILSMVCCMLVFSYSCKEKKEEMTDVVEEVEEYTLEDARADIEAANDEFEKFFAARDSVGLSNLYTKDTKILMSQAPAYSGRDAARTIMGGIMNSGITEVNLKTVEVWGDEDGIVEEGEYRLFVGEDQVDNGKYLVYWQQEDGNWKLHRDMFSSDVAPESTDQ